MQRAVRSIRATFALVMCFCSATPALAETTNAIVPDSLYASVMRTINPRLRETESLAYATALLENARRMHVDPTLIMAVVTVESHWDASALSYHGAEGLGQLKPETARELGVNPWSGSSNLHGITLYLHQLLAIFHDARQPIREAIAGYNAGPYAVRSSGGVPRNGETPRYVEKVLSEWRVLKARLGGDDVVAFSDENPIEALERSENSYWGAR